MRSPNNRTMGFLEHYADVAHEIDSSDAIKDKLFFMALFVVTMVFLKSVRDLFVWNPHEVSSGDEPCVTVRKFGASFLTLWKIFYLSGAVLFAGMAGECFSIPLDLLTSLYDGTLSAILRTPSHVFLTEYMVNLTVSGLHVWNCLRFLGDRLNVVSGKVGIFAAKRLFVVTPEDRELLMSPESAQFHFDVREMTGKTSFLPSSFEVRKYCLLFSKLIVFSLLARLIAFSILWASTLVSIVAEPLFFAGDVVFGVLYSVGGQRLIACVAIAWSIVMGVFLGHEQTRSGGEQKKSCLAGVYKLVFFFVVRPISNLVTEADDSYESL